MRPKQTSASRAKLLLPPTLVLLALLAVLPARWSAWVGELSRLVSIPTAPISRNVLSLSRSVISPPEPPKAEELRLLEEQKQAFETLYLRERDEITRLRDYIRELQQGLALNPAAKVQQIIAPVIGTSADLASGMLSIRTGTTVTVDRTTVATTTGLQLVGKVTSSSGPSCWVLPITRKGAGKIQVAIMTGEGAPVIGSNLTPVGDGRLQGDVMRIAGGGGGTEQLPTPEVGQLARLVDQEWPESSRMLIVGRVESVLPSPENPLRPMVIVRPLVNIERVSEVVLRVQATVQASGEAPR